MLLAMIYDLINFLQLFLKRLNLIPIDQICIKKNGLPKLDFTAKLPLDINLTLSFLCNIFIYLSSYILVVKF